MKAVGNLATSYWHQGRGFACHEGGGVLTASHLTTLAGLGGGSSEDSNRILTTLCWIPPGVVIDEDAHGNTLPLTWPIVGIRQGGSMTMEVVVRKEMVE